MLDELAVENLGVIGAARIEPGPGFTVITGETGAGKTLLLGALRLLIGGSGGGDRIGPAGNETRLEARFVRDEGGELVAARRIVATGRSRAYLDGAMAPVRRLSEEVGPLVEIVGQHDRLALTRPSEVRHMIDAHLDESGRAALAEYRLAWARLQDLESARRELGGDRRALERELDLVRFQAKEISDSGFEPGDDAELRRGAARLRNAAAPIADHLSAAGSGFGAEDGAEGIERAAAELHKAARLDPGLEPLAAQAAEAAQAVNGVSAEVARAGADLDHDAAALDGIEHRIALLGALQRKYGADLDEVLAFGAVAGRRAAEIEALLDRAGGLDTELVAARSQADELGTGLRTARAAAADRLRSAAVAHLRELGFDSPTIEIAVTATEAGPGGADRVELRFASDRALPAAPVAKAASGGELSRLVLALRLAGAAGEAPVVVFDEVDAGVGGSTALAVGKKLGALAADRQVLCVTHLPQVAAFADRHYVVTRDGAEASVQLVDGIDRVAEISRMLSGLPESTRGREHAEELLALPAAERGTGL